MTGARIQSNQRKLTEDKFSKPTAQHWVKLANCFLFEKNMKKLRTRITNREVRNNAVIMTESL